ncbi:hypothetical protein KAR91_13110 [Candidatus Pacearchaeota archaeon]|nr:hypothetical protein [Candidatus Pacearchaeota archaeon]
MKKEEKEKCDRCNNEPQWIASIFNSDSICKTCQEIEEKHPKFRDAQQRAMKRAIKGVFGNSYTGSGLPEDYSEFVNKQNKRKE